MVNPAPICTHVKTDGVRCGSPAVSGTDFCYHHSAVKTALGKVSPQPGKGGGFAPIPFVFPEDRASMQINYFLLLQAFNEGRVDLRYFKVMMSLLKSMAANLGKSGSLVGDRDQGSGTRDQKGRAQGSGRRAQKDWDEEADDPFADLRHLPKEQFNAAVRARADQWREEERAEEERMAAGSLNR